MMARARNIKPGFFKNEDLAECSLAARLLFPGLWMLADREGRLEDRPKRIKGEIFPFDAIEVEPLIDELVRWGFIRRYEIGGARYIQITNFNKHQTPHYSEKQSAIPAPDFQELQAHDAVGTPGGLQEDSEKPRAIKRGSQPPDSLNPEVNISRSPNGSRRAIDAPPQEFVAFWEAYPRKVSKPQALKAWRKLNPDTHTQERIHHGLERDRRSDQWQRDGGQFVPHPATWLNNRRWEDAQEVPACPDSGSGVPTLFRGAI